MKLFLTNAVTAIDSTSWTYIGLSIGWLSRGDNFKLWAYIFQQNTNYEYGNWVKGITISSSYVGDGKTFEYRFGPGITGFIKEIYTSDHLEDNYSFQLFKNTFGVFRYNWFASDFHIEPYYFDPGWGNGYVLPVDSGEEWDDLNTVNGDGWSSTCKREPLYKCTLLIGVAQTSNCEFMWGNGKYFSAYLWVKYFE